MTGTVPDVSMRGDAGRCRECGTVAHLDDLVELPGDDEPEYVCQDCREETG